MALLSVLVAALYGVAACLYFQLDGTANTIIALIWAVGAAIWVLTAITWVRES